MSLPGSKIGTIEPGCCYLVDMNPPRRSKPGKVRPVVVIQSEDTILAGSPGVVIVPLTSKTGEENILRVRIKSSRDIRLSKVSDTLIDQIHTIDRDLFLAELGRISRDEFARIRNGVRFLLDL